jgi:hypothetical protein
VVATRSAPGAAQVLPHEQGQDSLRFVYNLPRFAREKYDHFALRHLNSLGISLRSVTEPIDDTSTGKPMEGVAAFGQFDDDGRSEAPACAAELKGDLLEWSFVF